MATHLMLSKAHQRLMLINASDVGERETCLTDHARVQQVLLVVQRTYAA
jgi:hypothetical protein